MLSDQEDLQAVIVLNKADLLSEDSPRGRETEEISNIYRGLGVPVVYTSALRGTGLTELKELISNRVSVFSGHSGVGKGCSALERIIDSAAPYRIVPNQSR